MAQNASPALSKLTTATGAYYESVYALTPKQTTTDTSTQPQAGQTGTPLPGAEPWLIYAPFFLFFFLFIAAFGLLMLNRIWNLKRIVTSLVIALFVASIPYVLHVIQNGTGTETKAGPNELPRQVRIAQQKKGSILIMWDTETPQIGGVRYALKPLTISTASIVIEGNGSRTQNHTMTIHVQTPGTYELEIYSGTQWYDQNGKPLEFTVR
jgi:hypothetical protein